MPNSKEAKGARIKKRKLYLAYFANSFRLTLFDEIRIPDTMVKTIAKANVGIHASIPKNETCNKL